MEKLVCSTTLIETSWNNSRILDCDRAAAIAQSKRNRGKDMMIIGSASVVRILARHKIVTEPMQVGIAVLRPRSMAPGGSRAARCAGIFH